jgi:hypothetical protein
MGIFGYHNRAGDGCFLHPRGDIGRIAEHVGVLASAHTYHHRTRIDADPRGQRGFPGCSLSFAIASIIARPARAARSASLSCASG